MYQTDPDIVLGVTANAEAIITDLTAVLRGNEVASVADLRTVLTDLPGATSTGCCGRTCWHCGG